MTAFLSSLAGYLKRQEWVARADADLLGDYVAHGSTEAFSAIVARYSPLVWGICRRSLGNGPDAEDVFQATFLALARHANRLRHRESLAAWLHGVTRRIAEKARVARSRQPAIGLACDPVTPPEPTTSDLLLALDEELLRLPDRYRAPLLLCFWQGLTQREAAHRLGCSEGAVKGRLERGRRRLAERLTRRGFAPQALLACPLGTVAVPGALLARAAQCVGEAIPPSVTALANGVVVAGWARMRLVLLSLLLTSAVAVGVVGGGKSGPPETGPLVLATAASLPQGDGPAVDLLGDPLPEGAITRVGTTRLKTRNYVCCLVYSPDGRRLAYGTENGVLHVSAAADGKAIWEMKRGQADHNPLTELLFSPDGRLLAASGFWGKSVRLLDAATGKVLHTLPNTTEKHENWGRLLQGPTFAFTPDGKTLLVAGKDGTVHLWDVATGVRKATLGKASKVILSLTLTADGRTVAVAHYDGEMHLWDVEKREHLKQRTSRAPHPHLTALAPDGKTVAVVTGATRVELQEPEGGRRHALELGGRLMGMSFVGKGTTLITADADRRVVTWDVNTGKPLQTTTCDPSLFQWNAKSGTDLSVRAWFRADGKALAWDDVGTIRPWDLTTGREVVARSAYASGTMWAGFSADGRRLRVGGVDGELGEWDAATGRSLRTLRPIDGKNGTGFVAASDRRRILAVPRGTHPNKARATEGRIMVWDTSGDADPMPVREQVAWAWYAALTPDNRLIVSPESDGTIRVYEAATGKLVRSFPGGKLEYHPTFTPDGRWLVTVSGGSYPMKVRRYDFATGRVERELVGPANATDVALSPDGRLIASGHSKGPGGGPGADVEQDVLILWETSTGREIRRIPTGHYHFDSLAFSPDGRLLASSGSGLEIRLWEVASGQERRRYGGHGDTVEALDFAPDGTRLASASRDGTALVWRLFDPPPARPAALTTLWDDLAKDAATAHKAIAQLVVADGAVAFLGTRLQPVDKPSPAQLQTWITELGSDTFVTRDAADKNLRRVGGWFEEGLRRARDAAKDLEVRRRLDAILKHVERVEDRPDDLRRLRGIEVLERIGTAEARKILAALRREGARP